MVYIFPATFVIELILVGVWIYLVWMVRKKKTKLGGRWLKILKTFLKVAGISFVVFHACLIPNIILDLTGREGEPISFFTAYVTLWVFITATTVSLVVFLKGRRKTT